jgi:hypothetical protein
LINRLLDARKKIAKKLKENKVESKIWLGAQGPKMLEIAGFFDGVLLNYASKNLIQWATAKVGTVRKKTFQFGVYVPSYVYKKIDRKVYDFFGLPAQ